MKDIGWEYYRLLPLSPAQPAVLVPQVQDLELEDVITEIRRIRARQKAADMHDPECNQYPDELVIDSTAYTYMTGCNCWLTTEWEDSE